VPTSAPGVVAIDPPFDFTKGMDKRMVMQNEQAIAHMCTNAEWCSHADVA
jgi:hypothetical protein